MTTKCPGIRRARFAIVAAVSVCTVSGCAGGRIASSSVADPVERGKASYYHDSLHGNRTASGERYDREALTAAHRDLPFGTVVHVTNVKNGRSVDLRINDRGPFVRGRILDVSRRAAEKLDFVRDGVIEVVIEILERPSP